MYTFVGNVGCLYAETVDISLLERTVDFKSMLRHGIQKENQKSVNTYLPALGESKAPDCSRADGKERKCLFAL